MKRNTAARLQRLLNDVALSKKGWFLRLFLQLANNWVSIVVLYFGLTFTAAALFAIIEEKHTLGDGIWWAFITNLTIGYGDVYPGTVAGRVLGIVLAHAIILMIIPMIIAQITLKLLVDNDRFTHDEQEDIKNSLSATTAELREVRAKLDLLMATLNTSSPPKP